MNAKSRKRKSSMTVTEYADHRGVSQPTVSRAIQSGRLRDSVERGPNDRPVIVDVDLADREWEANTDQTKVRDRGEEEGAEDLIAATTRWKRAQADKEEMEVRKRRGELVKAADVERALSEAFNSARSSLLALPTQLKQDLPHLTIDDVSRIDARVREALEALAAKGATAAAAGPRTPGPEAAADSPS